MADALKTTRGTKKSAVTRAVNAIGRFVAERDKAKVLEEMEKAKTAFAEFEDVHYRYHNTLKDEEDIDQNDSYFDAAQSNYVDAVKKAQKWLDSLEEANAPKREKKPEMTNQQELLGLVNLPKMELESYDGNPLTYHCFMATFEEVVGKVDCDAKTKLTRLLQYTKGDAKEAIRTCILLDGEEGYKQAKDILKKRFGNDYIVTERIVHDVRNGKQIRSANDLQQLANELQNCQKTLLKMAWTHI